MLIWIIVIAFALLGQMTVFGHFDFWGAKPDLVLITVMFVSLHKGAVRGSLTGFIGGLAEDLASGGLPGVNAFVKVLTGYAMGMSRRRFDRGNRLFQFTSVLVVSGLAQVLFFSLSRLCGMEMSLKELSGMLLPFAVLNAAAAPFVFRALEGVLKHDKSKPD